MPNHNTPRFVAHCSSSVRTRARLLIATSLSAGLSSLACSGRYDIGQARPSLLDSPLIDASQIGVLIIDGPEDADAATDIGIARGIGDVDGDGYGDLLAVDSTVRTGYFVVYGGPRSGGEAFVGAAEGARMGPMIDEDLGPVFELARGGDVDGDGRDDLLTTGGIRYDEYSFSDGGMRFTHSDEAWTLHQSRLLYGDPARPEGELLTAGANFNPAPRVFPRALAEGLAGDFEGYHAQQVMYSTALGDVDADGYDDVALSVWFELDGYNVRRDSHGEHRERETFQRDVNTYVFYGGSRRFEAEAARNQPAARLPNIGALESVGDINGDGLIDFIAAWGAPSQMQRTVAIVPGKLGRLDGEVTLESSLIIEDANGGGRSVGDLDGDGYGDFVVSQTGEDGAFRWYLFYGAPELTEESLSLELADASFEMHSGSSGQEATRLELIPVGDWTGDGSSDLLLTLHAETLAQEGPRSERGQARIIPGSGERYSGRYAPSDIPPTADGKTAGAFVPLGDVDGDGLADLAFSARTLGEAPRGYIKYGGPVAADVH